MSVTKHKQNKTKQKHPLKERKKEKEEEAAAAAAAAEEDEEIKINQKTSVKSWKLILLSRTATISNRQSVLKCVAYTFTMSN